MMKIMKTGWMIICFAMSLAALGLSCYSLTSQYYADIPTTVLSLVGVCATIIVGISVVDTISLHSMLNSYDKRMEGLTKKIDNVSLMEERIREMKKQTNILFHYTWGMSYANDGSYYKSLSEFWKAFLLAAETNDLKRAKSCISSLEITIDKIEQQKPNDIENPDEIPVSIPDIIKDSDVYLAFGENVESLLLKIRSLSKASSTNNK